MIRHFCWRLSAMWSAVLFSLVSSSIAWPQGFLEQELESLIIEFEKSPDVETQIKVLDSIVDTIEERLEDHDDRPHEDLNLAEMRYLVDRLLPLVLTAASSGDRLVCNRGFVLLNQVLDTCSSRFDLRHLPIESIAVNAALETEPYSSAIANLGVIILYRFFLHP